MYPWVETTFLGDSFRLHCPRIWAWPLASGRWAQLRVASSCSIRIRSIPGDGGLEGVLDWTRRQGSAVGASTQNRRPRPFPSRLVNVVNACNFVFIPKASEASLWTVCTRWIRLFIPYLLGDVWTQGAQNWWVGRGHGRKHPRKGIFLICQHTPGSGRGTQVPLLSHGDEINTPNLVCRL